MNTVLEMPKIKDKLAATYKANVSFFKQHIPTIYKMVLEGASTPEITIDSKTGELHVLQNNKTIYPEGAIDFSMKEVARFINNVKNYNYAPSKSFTKLQHLIINPAFEKSHQFYRSNRHLCSSETISRLDLIIFGVGLGYHVEMLINKKIFNHIVVVEEDIKNFKASLYSIRWDNLLTSLDDNIQISFVINNNDPAKFISDLKKQYYTMFPSIVSSCVAYSHKPFEQNYKNIKIVMEEFRTNMKVMYEKIGPDAHRLMNANENSRLGHKIINFKESNITGDNIKIAIVGAGPSLDIYFHILNSHRDQFYIITVGSGLSSLLEMGINPNMHLELEYKHLAQELLVNVNSRHPLNDINLVCTYEVHPKIPELFKSVRMFVPETSELSDLFPKEYILRQGGVNCANAGLTLARKLSDAPIYLFGIDLAYTNNEHHSKFNISQRLDLSENLSVLNENKSRFIKVKGTQGNLLSSKATQLASRLAIEQSLAGQTKNAIYNCSHGANLLGTQFLSTEDLASNLNQDKSNVEVLLFEKLVPCLEFNINKASIKRLKIAFKVTSNLCNGLENRIYSSKDQLLKIHMAYRQIGEHYFNTLGLYRLILAINRTPILQLYTLINFLPEEKLGQIMDIWLSEHKAYVQLIEHKLKAILTSESHYVTEEWTDILHPQ